MAGSGRKFGSWVKIGFAVVLVAIAVAWNVWTFAQHGKAQRDLAILGVEPATGEVFAPGSPEAGEMELLLDADRRGILEENFTPLLSEPQKRALAVERSYRLELRSAERNLSLAAGLVFILLALTIWFFSRSRRS